jgi:hypothetical protein
MNLKQPECQVFWLFSPFIPPFVVPANGPGKMFLNFFSSNNVLSISELLFLNHCCNKWQQLFKVAGVV